MNDIRSFQDLDCWKACRALRIFVAKECLPVAPRDEKYRWADQILRAARSTTANIAEGYGRFHYLDNAKFCSNARGSVCEVLDHFITAQDEGLIPADLCRRGEELVEQALKPLNGYIAYLQRAGGTNSLKESSEQYGIDTTLPNNSNQ